MADSVAELKIKGLDKLIKKFDSLSNITVKKQLERTMLRTTEMVKYRARELVPVDTGALRRSIRNIVQASDKEIIGRIGPTEPYGASVEFGTKPHFPPVRALERWAKKRGLNPYVVARSIAKKGTIAHPYLIPAFKELRRRIIEEFKRTIDYLLKL